MAEFPVKVKVEPVEVVREEIPSSSTAIPADPNSKAFQAINDKQKELHVLRKKADLEFEEIKKQVQAEQEEINSLSALSFIAVQKLRTLNENGYRLHKQLQNQNKKVEELMQKRKRLEVISKGFQLKEKSGEVVQNKGLERQTNHIKAVKRNQERSAEYVNALEKLEQLKLIKQTVDNNDPEIQSLMNGVVLEQVQAQIEAVKDSFAYVNINSEMLMIELDEAREKLQKSETSLLIDQKQHQARLRRARNVIGELRDTENHLKRTLEFLQKN